MDIAGGVGQSLGQLKAGIGPQRLTRVTRFSLVSELPHPQLERPHIRPHDVLVLGRHWSVLGSTVPVPVID